MKYMIKTPVEAIQWTGDNQREVSEFISHATKSYSIWIDKSGNLMMFWKDLARRKFKAVIPLFGWVVRDGKIFQFYKNTTFRKTFEEVPDDEHKEITDTMIKDLNKMLEDVRDSIENGHIFAKYYKLTNLDGGLAKLVNNFYRGDEKVLEEIKKQLTEGLKDMAGSDTHKATFESVLDEMKELHAKKNACYGDAAHVNFLKYGPVASLSRLSEKMQRAEHILLSGKCEVKDEPLTQTLIDMAITSAMLYMELKNKE